MRPVERGDWPLDEQGQRKVYSPYRDARDDLIARLGDYCSFCGLSINNPDVEHMTPKSLQPTLKEHWHNFLLACTWCNSTKGNKDTDALDPYWPDRDNTFRAFAILSGGRIKVNWRLGQAKQDRARVTADLVGLLRQPGGPAAPTASDRRWLKRIAAWDLSVRWRDRIAQNDTPALRDAVVDIARLTGFLGVWLRVFRDDQAMRAALIDAFTGTAADAFTPDWKLRARGQL